MRAKDVVPLAVTVSAQVPERLVVIARERAASWGLPYYPRRRNQGLERLLGVEADAFLVLGDNGWTLRDSHGELRFSPGMATLRIKRLASGEGADDVLLRLSELRPGDVVVDATAGLVGDALVAARAVGPKGRVLAIESSFPLWALVSEGLRVMKPFEGSAEVELLHGDSLTWLRAMGDQSVDCVFFDPMFQRPKRGSESFELMRRYASHQPLTLEHLAEARRVARRWVVVKSGRYGKEFRSLGLTRAQTSLTRPIVWARVPGGQHA